MSPYYISRSESVSVLLPRSPEPFMGVVANYFEVVKAINLY